MFWRYLTTHMEVKALALSIRDHTKSPPSFLGSLSVALATLGILPFQIKDCTRAFFLLRASSHPGAMPAWYHAIDKHMILATMTLSMGEDESLASQASICL
jgi:uncharacterized membrane protein YbaN (DUF454 family)